VEHVEGELAQFISENKLPTGLSVFYLVFFPEGVETQDLDGSTSIDGYCGYHSSFGSGAAIVLLERAVRAGRLGPGAGTQRRSRHRQRDRQTDDHLRGEARCERAPPRQGAGAVLRGRPTSTS